MSGTLQNFSHLPDSGRVVPPIMSPNNWEFVAQYFQFWEFDGQGLVLANVDVSVFDETLYFLFFGHDRPLLGQVCSYYADATLTTVGTDTVILPEPTYCEEVFPQSDATKVNGFIATANTVLQIGQTMIGVSATNDVSVEGYPLNVAILDRGLVNAEVAAIKPYVKGHILCEGFLHGQPFAQGMTGANTQIPIILAEPDYTQAMKDAGNRVTQGTVDLVIVGLWAGNAR